MAPRPTIPRRVRLARRLALNPLFQRVGRTVVPRLDGWLHRVSGGRIHLADAAVPTLVLTVPGRRSGEPRQTPLAYVPDGEDFLVVGSNWGQTSHPAWTVNLLAAGRAVVETHGRRIPVEARLLEGQERAQAWQRLTAVWPTYDDYTARAGGRELRVFRLVPDESTMDARIAPTVEA